MRKPLTQPELKALKDMIAAKDEAARLRKTIAHALKALDTGDLKAAREALFYAL